MKNFLALLVARNKEYYRDKGALAWSFIFPIFIIMAFTFAFSDNQPTIFKIGVLQPTDVNTTADKLPKVLQADYIQQLPFDDLDKALSRIKHHQIDLLFDIQKKQYWINKRSSAGQALEVLLSTDSRQYHKQVIEGKEIRYVDWAMPGVLGMNLMFSALFGVGFVIVRYRKNGVLKRLQATPVTALEFLAAQVISRLCVIITVVTIIYIGCDLFIDFLMIGNYWLLYVIAFLGGFSMISFGLVLTSRTESEELAGGLLNFASFPMLLLSELWFALDSAPNWLIGISQLLPLTHTVQAAREVMINGATLADISHHLWALTFMCIIFLFIASMLFRWYRE